MGSNEAECLHKQANRKGVGNTLKYITKDYRATLLIVGNGSLNAYLATRIQIPVLFVERKDCGTYNTVYSPLSMDPYSCLPLITWLQPHPKFTIVAVFSHSADGFEVNALDRCLVLVLGERVKTYIAKGQETLPKIIQRLATATSFQLVSRTSRWLSKKRKMKMEYLNTHVTTLVI